MYYQDFRDANSTWYKFLPDLPFWHPLALEWDTRCAAGHRSAVLWDGSHFSQESCLTSQTSAYPHTQHNPGPGAGALYGILLVSSFLFGLWFVGIRARRHFGWHRVGESRQPMPWGAGCNTRLMSVCAGSSLPSSTPPRSAPRRRLASWRGPRSAARACLRRMCTTQPLSRRPASGASRECRGGAASS